MSETTNLAENEQHQTHVYSVIDGCWGNPPRNLILSSHDIHIFCASLDQPTWRIQQLAQTLSSDEQNRAKRFYFERDKQRFIVGRGLLRTILGCYLGLEPSQLQFSYGDRGKPYLAKTNDKNSSLRFNLSHSHKLVLYAFTRNREIGIDLEQIRAIPSVEQLAERFFSAGENAVLRTLPPDQKIVAFFNCWTRKEAYIKAIGDGLVLSLDRFEVTLAPGESAGLASIDGDRSSASRWFIQELTPAAGYVGAIALQGHGWHIRCWQWPDCGC